MKTRFILIALSILYSFSLSAQKNQIKFGKISEHELKTSTCSIDSNASAYVIADIGHARFNITQSDIKLITDRHVRIKILNKESFDKGNFSISLYNSNTGDEEKVTSIKGAVYNLVDGKEEKHKLSKDNIFRENVSKHRNMIKVTMPNIEEGSVVELKYTIESPFLFNLDAWYFQDDIPTLYSEFSLERIEWYNYKTWVEGYLIVDKSENSRTQKFSYSKSATITAESGRQSGGIVEFEARVSDMVFSANNVPAFKDEPYITTKFDYLSSVHFELQSTDYPWSIFKKYTTDWASINKLLLDHDHFGRTIKSDNHLKDIAASISASANSDLERAIAAYQHIQATIAWNGHYSKFSDHNTRKAYSEQIGNSADINLNLVSLARLLELEAYPVVISTRKHGMIRPGQPAIAQFNHTIAAIKIDGKYMVLDAMSDKCPYNLLPANSLNGQGRIVNNSGGEWIDLYTNTPKKEIFVCDLAFNEDFELNGKYTYKASEYGALQFREWRNEFESEEDFIAALEKKIGVTEINDLKINNLDSTHKAVSLEAQINTTNGVNVIGDMIYLNPKVINRHVENIFKSEERLYPIDYNYPMREQYMFTIQLPEGYEVEELPAPISVALPDNKGKYLFMVKPIGNKIQLTCQFMINETLFPGINYPELKSFYQIIVTKEAEQLVLKKSN